MQKMDFVSTADQEIWVSLQSLKSEIYLFRQYIFKEIEDLQENHSFLETQVEIMSDLLIEKKGM